MEATQKRPPLDSLKRFVGTRRGAVIVAAATAVLAGVVLLAFITQYRNSVKSGNATVSVLVANRLIPKGTSGDLVVSGQLFRPATTSEDQAKVGFVTDASALSGKIATRDIYPGQQITAADFLANADPVRGQIKGNQRAIAIPIDAAHGLLGQVRTGDHVDVLAGFNATNGNTGQGRAILRTILQDILVLQSGSASTSGPAGGGASNTSLLVRVTDKQASQLAFASDNGKIWFVLRPTLGAKQSAPSTVDIDSELSGVPSLTTNGTGGR
jgi:Flp pilus assembly protein CpaB